MEEQNPTLNYKIMPGKEYMVFRSEYNGKVFYKIQLQKKNYDDTKEIAYKTIRFKNDVDLPDRTIIIPKAGFEDFYNKDKYTTIFTLFITDFDIKENEEVNKSEAIANYNSEITISEEDIPF